MVGIIHWIIELTPLLTLQLLLVLLLRKPIRRWLGAGVSYQLWILPPVWCLSSLLLSTWISQLPTNLLESPILLPAVSSTISENWLNTLTASKQIYFTYTKYIHFNNPVWPSIFFLWLIGIVFTGTWQLIKAIRFHGSLQERDWKECSPFTREILQKLNFPGSLKICHTDLLTSPAIYGIWKTSLLLPTNLDDIFDLEQQGAMLSHEAVHYHRRDNFINLLAVMLRSIFWFNPVFYFAHHCFRLDQEFSCDARVLQDSSRSQRKTYAHAVMSSASGRKYSDFLISVSGWNNLQDLKERTAMLNTHHRVRGNKTIKHGLLLGLALLGTIGCSAVLVTSEGAQTPEYPNTVETDTREIIIQLQFLEVTLDEGVSAAFDNFFFDTAIFNSRVENGWEVASNFTDFTSVVELLSNRGSTQILSWAVLKTRNKQKAEVKIGKQEYLIFNEGTVTVPPKDNANTKGSVDGDFQPFFSGISLGVTPLISSPNMISLHLNPSVIFVSTDDQKVSRLIARKLDTTIEIERGKIIVLGGLTYDTEDEGRTLKKEFIILVKPLLASL